MNHLFFVGEVTEVIYIKVYSLRVGRGTVEDMVFFFWFPAPVAQIWGIVYSRLVVVGFGAVACP